MKRLAAILLALPGAGAVAADPVPPELAFAGVEAYRAADGQAAFVFRTQGPADPARVRLFLDLDGPQHGEPGTGAEYMLEGARFLRHPSGGGTWAWEDAGAPETFAVERAITVVLPRLPGLSNFAWFAETTRPDWTAGDRFPPRGGLAARLALLPPLDARNLARTVADPALDLVSADAYRAEGGLAFQLRFAAEPDPARVRLLLDFDGPASGEPASGAEFMVEGATLFAYPPGASGWTWNALEPALWVRQSNTLTCLLFHLPATTTFHWVAETTTPEWRSADRLPALGAAIAHRPGLPALPALNRPQPVDISELLARAAPALTARLEDELGTQEWTRAGVIAPPVWNARRAGAGTTNAPLPLKLFLTDAADGRSVELKPLAYFTAGARQRWGGSSLGVDWVLVADETEDGALELSGQLKAREERCVSVAIGVELDLGGWTWHDDVRYRRTMEAGGEWYTSAGSLPYGRRGEQSLYLFGIVEGPQGAIEVETDPDEPRVFQIAAEPARRFFGVHYDLGLSPQTLKFPGRAAFRCTFRAVPPAGDGAFRAALDRFYDRHPAFRTRRTPQVGLWMPFFDIGRLPGAEDFGFAYLEKEGPYGADVDYAESNNVLVLQYIEPWLYWLPMPPAMRRTDEQALAAMRTLAATGDDRRNALAASALVAAVRQTNGAPLMTFLDTPWNNGARMEVSTDPELPTPAEPAVNRAMVEWQTITRSLADPRVDGIYLDSMQAMQVVDYNPAALAVADHPLVYAPDARRPGIAMPVSAFEFTSLLGRYLQDHGKFLMGNFPCWRWPFFMPYIDIPGDETTWLNGGRYAPMEDRHLNARRALSGHKAWGFLQATDFSVFDRAMSERYLLDCLFWAFMPSFFSHDGANDPYWLDPKLYERDRPLFRRYLPIIRRLAAAGWEPVHAITAADSRVWIEQYGRADGPLHHLTLRQRTPLPLRTELLVPQQDEPLLVVDPLNATFEVVEAGSGIRRLPLLLEADGVAVRDVVRLSALAAEREFAGTWTSDSGEGAALAASLASWSEEHARGAAARVLVPSPLLRGEEPPVQVVIPNAGDRPLSVSNIVVMTDDGPQVLHAGPTRIEPGTVADFDGFLRSRPLADPAWVEVRWNLDAVGEPLAAVRRFRAPVAAPLRAALSTDHVVSVEPVAGVDIRVFNYADTARPVSAQLRGDFSAGPVEAEVAPGGEAVLHLEIPSGERTGGRAVVRVRSRDLTLLDTPIQLTFLGDAASLARDSRVAVEVDSTYGGYTPTPLTDGIVDTAGVPWNEAAWASEETAAPHWVRLTFPQPTAVSELRMVWNFEGDVRYTSQRGRVRGWTADGQVLDLASFTNATAEADTVVPFETIQLRAIELFQPVGGGPASRPNLLWLSEIEVR